MIPVVLSTGSVYTYGTSRAFELAGRAGYDGVELIVDDRWDTRQATYLRRLIDQHDVPIRSVHSPFASLRLPGWPREEVERVKIAAALADTVGAQTLNLHLPFRTRDVSLGFGLRQWRTLVPGPTPDQRAYQRWLTGGGLAELQARTRALITVENLPLRRQFGRAVNPYAMNTWDEIAFFPNVCLDTTHCGTTGSDLLAVYEQLAHRVRHIHLSDYDGRYQHRSIDRGHLPLASFLRSVISHGYEGVLVVELDPGGLPVQDEVKVEAELRRNLEFCRQHLGHSAPSDTVMPAAV